MAGPGKALTFLDLMGQVGAGTRAIANLPGAKRIPESFAKAQRGMTPAEVIEQYNKAQMFGKDPTTGEVRQLQQTPKLPDPFNSLSVSDRARMVQGKLPLERGVKQRVYNPSSPYTTLSEFSLYPDRDIVFGGSTPEELYHLMYNRAEDAQARRPVPDEVGVYDIGALDAGEGMGAMQYAALYDQLRAAGAFSGPTALTDINELRRLGNVMSYGLRHGDYENIAPVISRMNRSPQLFSRAENADWMARPMMEVLQQGRGDPLFEQAVALRPQHMTQMTPDQITGTLGFKESQLTRIAGPVREPVMLEPGDLFELRHLAIPALTDPNAYGIQRGIGPNTLGRAATVEQLIEKILAGRTGEEAAEEILNQSKRRGMNLEEGYKGRYKDGGSVALFSGGGKAKKTVAEMASELATKGVKTPDMSRRKFMSLGNALGSSSTTPNLPVTAAEAARMSQDPAISAIEKIAAAPVTRRQVIQGALAQGAQQMVPGISPASVMSRAIDAATSAPRVANTIPGLVAQGLNMKLKGQELVDFVNKSLRPDDVNTPESIEFSTELLASNINRPEPEIDMYYDYDPSAIRLQVITDQLFPEAKRTPSGMALRPTLREVREHNPEGYGRLVKSASKLRDRIAEDLADE
jgi:hypothetical protein